MKIKNSEISRWAMGILFGLPLVFLLSNCTKNQAVDAAGQNGLAGKSNGHTLSVDYHVVWSSIPDSNTARINRALSNTTYTRVILDYNSSGWTSDQLHMYVPNQTLWIAGSGSTPGHLIAKTGGFLPVDAIFIKMEVPGCIVNGYSNGSDTTQGRATIEMFKSSYTVANGYTLSDGRDAIHAGVNNGAVEGVIIKNSGGDGVYLSGGNSVNVKDVIVDGANRNGISIIKGNNTTVTDCVFKNTSGATTGAPAGPWAGMDVEPNGPTDTLNNVIITSCVFSGNAGNNISVGLGKMVQTGGISASNTVYFYSCTTAGGSANGALVASLKNTGPTTGEIYFQRCAFNYPALNGVYVENWAAGQMLVDFNRCSIYNAGASSSSSVPFQISGSAAYTLGHVYFEGSTNRIDDFNSSHPYIIGGGAAQAYDFVKADTGAVTIQRHYTSTNPIMSLTPGSGYTNTNIAVHYTVVPWP